jgi:hypothetical protein
MMNAIGISGIYRPAEEALVHATELAIAALGIGTVIALVLIGLVLSVEALARRWSRRRPSRRPRARTAGTRRGRREAF